MQALVEVHVQLLAGAGVFRMIGEVCELVRVGLHVIQLGGAVFVPEVSPIRSAQAVVAAVKGA